MTGKFFASVSSVTVLAVSLTPEMTNALAILVAAVFVGAVNLYMARTSRLVQLQQITKAIAPVEAKIDALAPVVAKIDGHVNSEKTKAEGESLSQKLQIELQRETINELKKAAALLAQAKATSDVSNAVASAAVAGATTVHSPAVVLVPASAPVPTVIDGAAPAASLEQIDKNTASIDQNTKRTEASMQELKKDL